MSPCRSVLNDTKGSTVSLEFYLVVDGIKRSTKLKANIPLRGTGEYGVQLRDTVTIVEDRMLESGKNEIVAGVFDARGSVFDVS